MFIANLEDGGEKFLAGVALQLPAVLLEVTSEGEAMQSRPLPGGGFQHTVTLTLSSRPPAAFTDPVLGLEQARNGLVLPLVEAIQQTSEGCVVLVSVFEDTEEPTAQELADLHGTVAELVWFDRHGVRT